jgi:subfamily B ATP-binding cassette protein MsbA
MEGRTSFVVAHRLSTVLHADRIVVLDEGRAVAMGTHAELLRNSELYRELYSRQFRKGGDSVFDKAYGRGKWTE